MCAYYFDYFIEVLTCVVLLMKSTRRHGQMPYTPTGRLINVGRYTQVLVRASTAVTLRLQ